MNSSSIRTAGSKCNLILQKCLAIQLHKTRGVIPCGPNNTGRNGDGGVGVGVGGGVGGAVDDYWMYDNGYLLFQGFLEANSKCFWNLSLLEAMKELQFEGYVSQGILLVRGSPCALEILRSAWSRNVLKAPTNYTISQLGRSLKNASHAFTRTTPHYAVNVFLRNTKKNCYHRQLFKKFQI
ncbi:hypothetical protein Phum_PHUM605240 [Pediculus humanus corporis]|uniref:Storkhead-box protein 1 n=1 Tax=Pediculus humanus subsp. corporis TaxID=121224 RepID=E0W3J5_PEDHC|nr:uncharacterized protein Phum_PHUM605240 [Pediculus humanus corporis]EEB20201.1 hypothetical protein Phum_PHUM605240 [Pediculus humanus corporis]